MSNIPSAPDTTGAKPKKDHTALIVVLVVVFVVVVLPVIVVTVLAVSAFKFLGDHMDDIKDIAHSYSFVAGGDEGAIYMSHNEAVAARNIVAQIENTASENRTISKRDCLYLERLAKYYIESNNGAAVAEEINLCGEGIIKGSVDYKQDINKSYDYGQYRLALSVGSVCHAFHFDKNIETYSFYTSNSTSCSAGTMVDLKIVDTGETLEPAPDRIKLEVNDEDDDVQINIKSRA
jgi:hypothetical protein